MRAVGSVEAARGPPVRESRVTTRTAACSCGQLTVAVSGDPVRVSVCHCLACQRRSGSVFAAQAKFRREDVKTAGPSSTYVRAGDEGPGAEFHFCPACGSTVYYFPIAQPQYTVVPVGVFADPTFPAPTFSVYEERKHGWVALPEQIEHMR